MATATETEVLCSRSHYGPGGYISYKPDSNRRPTKAKYIPIAVNDGTGYPGSVMAKRTLEEIKAGQRPELRVASNGSFVALGEPVCGTHRDRHEDSRLTAFEIGVDEISVDIALARYEKMLSDLEAHRARMKREDAEYAAQTYKTVWAIKPGSEDNLPVWLIVEPDGRTAGRVRVSSHEGFLRIDVTDANSTSRAGNLSWAAALQGALSLAMDYVRQGMEKE